LPRLDRLDANELASLAVLAAVPGFDPESDPAGPLRDALAGVGVVPASIDGVAALLEAGTLVSAGVWKQYARDEVVEVAAWGGAPDLLVRLGQASQVRTVVGVRASSPRRPDWHWPLRVGFLPGSEGFTGRVKRALAWLNESVDVIVLGRDAGECDVAVAVGREAIEAYQRSVGVKAEMLLVLGRGRIDSVIASNAAEGADAVDASGSAVVLGGAPHQQVRFVEQLVVELSHAEELPTAIHRATSSTNQRALLEVSADLIAASNLRRSLPALERRAHRGKLVNSKTEVHHAVGHSIGARTGRPMALPEYATRLAVAADDLVFDHEGGAASAVAAVSRAINRAAPERPRPRFLQVQVFVEASPRVRARTFLAGHRHVAAVRVGSASTDWLATDEAFPDAGLFPRGVKKVDLDVGLVLPDLDHGTVATSRLTLKRTGDSTVADLPFEVPAGVKRIRATVTVSHGSQVLQVGELRGPCLQRKPAGGTATRPRISFDLKSITSDGSLERLPATRETATATVLVGDAIAVVSGEPGDVRIDPAVGDPLAKVGGAVATVLRDAADPFAAAASRGSPLAEKAGVTELRKIAKVGSDLLASLETASVNLAPLRAADRIRLVLTREAPVLPLELVYDGPVGNRAEPCAQSVDACTCAGPAKESVICLRRFWGLSKLIERHAPIDAAAGSSRSVADPKKPLAKLAPFTSALFGATAKVPDDQRRLMYTEIAGLVGSLEDAPSWAAWRAKARRRALLIGVVHNEVVAAPLTALEIAGDLLQLGQLDEDIVGRGKRGIGPVVMLIGCRTALPDNPLVSFVSRLRARGASVVVGSVADIPALHAPALLMAVLRALSKQLDDNGSTTFAAAMRAARATLFANGWVLGMALVAYGDADWLLTKRSA
jgi:hypothetical protein